jgi:hypothetical protein
MEVLNPPPDLRDRMIRDKKLHRRLTWLLVVLIFLLLWLGKKKMSEPVKTDQAHATVPK